MLRVWRVHFCLKQLKQKVFFCAHSPEGKEFCFVFSFPLIQMSITWERERERGGGGGEREGERASSDARVARRQNIVLPGAGRRNTCQVMSQRGKWFPWVKMTRLHFGRSGREIIRWKTRYFDPKVCSQCIVMAPPYPSSLGGVYQPVGKQGETPAPPTGHSLVDGNHDNAAGQPTQLTLACNSPFFSWICTRDLYDCCALARLYWFWKKQRKRLRKLQ